MGVISLLNNEPFTTLPFSLSFSSSSRFILTRFPFCRALPCSRNVPDKSRREISALPPTSQRNNENNQTHKHDRRCAWREIILKFLLFYRIFGSNSLTQLDGSLGTTKTCVPCSSEDDKAADISHFTRNKDEREAIWWWNLRPRVQDCMYSRCLIAIMCMYYIDWHLDISFISRRCNNFH